MSDSTRLQLAFEQPPLLRLHRALSRLSSVLTFANTGAHPDDEHNTILAALRLRDGMRTIILCSTRGEGGQNSLGPERGAALSVLRTTELELAARRISANIHWMGHGPDDALCDFGFSKSGIDTLRRWGKDETVRRFVRFYRLQRPDLVLPTFLDVPGQHGHHRAMTWAAQEAIALAADPAFFCNDLAPWQVQKLYLPAWSGAGTAYDDEVPPPPETFTYCAEGKDPATGLSYGFLGEWSRAAHASQGMGTWANIDRNRFPLHLAYCAGTRGDGSFASNLAADLSALADMHSMPQGCKAALQACHAECQEALSNFPNHDAILKAAIGAKRSIEQALNLLPEALEPLILHKLKQKQREIDALIIEAAECDLHLSCSGAVQQGQPAELIIHSKVPLTETEIMCHEGFTATATEKGFSVALEKGPLPQTLFSETYDDLGGNGLAHARVKVMQDGLSVEATIDCVPKLRFELQQSPLAQPECLIFNSQTPQNLRLPQGAALMMPQGWISQTKDDGVMIAPQSKDVGLARADLIIDGQPAYHVERFSYPHHALYSGPLSHVKPANVALLSLPLKVPQGRILSISGGNDRVGFWLERIGCDVKAVDAETLPAAETLMHYKTIIIGLMAFAHPALQALVPNLKTFVAEGGHLVTLYHRPQDGWNGGQTPPLPLSIGLPSLRWRVTSPDAPVTILAPDHPLLSGPNSINPADFDGWVRERGLYFASHWHESYQPLLQMNDDGDPPLQGALLSAKIGKGRHSHCALALHYQLEAFVPGAFRLLANLVQREKD